MANNETAHVFQCFKEVVFQLFENPETVKSLLAEMPDSRRAASRTNAIQELLAVMKAEPASLVEQLMQDLDQEQVLHQYNKIFRGCYDFLLDLPNSKGSWLKTEDGRNFINFHAFFAADALGPNYTPYVTRLLSLLMKHPSCLVSSRISNSDFPLREVAVSIMLFRQFTLKNEADWYLFFIDGGALAVENAIKIAQDWKVRLNFKRQINKHLHYRDFVNAAIVGDEGEAEKLFAILKGYHMVDAQGDVAPQVTRTMTPGVLADWMRKAGMFESLSEQDCRNKCEQLLTVLRSFTEIKGHKIIHFHRAFHGRSGYTLTMTNTKSEKSKYFLQHDWPCVPSPHMRHMNLNDGELKQLQADEAQTLAVIQDILKSDEPDIAAIIIEPIQSEGGDRHFRPAFLQALQHLCRTNHLLFMCDEVQTGMGITGKPFASDHMGIEPDVITFGKKSQVCGVFARKARIDEVADNVFNVPSRINSTFGGNNFDYVRLGLICECLMTDKVLDNVNREAAFLNQTLQKLQHKYPNLVLNVRGLGLLCAFDLPTTRMRDALIKQAFEDELLLLGCGEKTIRFRPVLTVTRAELEEGLHRLEQALLKIENSECNVDFSRLSACTA